MSNRGAADRAGVRGRRLHALLLVAATAPAQLQAQAAAGVDTGPPSSWNLGVTLQGTWYENAYFLGPALEESAWSTHGSATLGWSHRFKTGHMSLAGWAGALYYPEIDNFNQPIYGGRFGLSWSPSRRTTFRLSQSYSRTNTRFLTESDASPPTPDPPPIETLPTPGEGPPLPTSGASYATTSAGLEQRLSQRWQLALDGSYSLYRYDEQLLQESEQVYGSVQLGRQVGRRGQIYLAYGYSSSWFDAGRQRAHQMLVGGRKQATRGVGFELAGGVGYLESTGSFYPSGRAGLTVSGRRTRLAFLYYRDFGQAYGYGRQTVGDIFSVGLSWTPARRWSFSAGYNFGYRSDPSDETYSITYSSASAGLSWNIGAGFDVAARYSWDRNETEGLPPVEGGRAMASLSWDVDWR